MVKMKRRIAIKEIFYFNHCMRVIDAAIYLYNSISEYELCNGIMKLSQLNSINNDGTMAFMRVSPINIVGVFGDETNGENQRGWPTDVLRDLNLEVVLVIDALCNRMTHEGLVQLTSNYYITHCSCTVLK